MAARRAERRPSINAAENAIALPPAAWFAAASATCASANVGLPSPWRAPTSATLGTNPSASGQRVGRSERKTVQLAGRRPKLKPLLNRATPTRERERELFGSRCFGFSLVAPVRKSGQKVRQQKVRSQNVRQQKVRFQNVRSQNVRRLLRDPLNSLPHFFCLGSTSSLFSVGFASI